MNYKKTEHFEPIAMKCTQEQFESIKTILINNKLYLNCVSKFDIYPYLVNFGEQNSKTINNIHKKGFGYIWDLKHCLYETFNAETFLKACGIVSEPLYQLTAKEVVHAYENPQWLKDTFKECFETELEVNRWYKNKLESLHSIFYATEINKENNVFSGYGFQNIDERGFEWISSSKNHWSVRGLQPATEKEVEEALQSEWKKRAIAEDYTCVTINGETLYNCGFITEFKDNKLYLDSSLTQCIFDNGNWAEIIPIPTYTIHEAESKFNIKIKAV